jgi:hypothetical protein
MEVTMEQVVLDQVKEAFIHSVSLRVTEIFCLAENKSFCLDDVDRQVYGLAVLLEDAKVFGIVPVGIRMLTGKDRTDFRREVVALARLGLKSQAVARVVEELAKKGVSEGLRVAIEVSINERIS